MDKESIVNELAQKRVVENIIENIVGEITADEQDLAQDIYLDLLVKDEEKIVGMYEGNALRYFIARMITNNIISVNSPFYYKYKKNRNYVNIEDMLDKI